ncbi:MAG: hypothetical protein K6G71_02340, partial [Clostridiales bacterium]|nr:hypothetical protein [Clostridiales bacterium]
DLNKDGVCDRCGYIVDESLAGDTGSAGNGADNEYHCWCGQGHPNNLIGWIQCFFTSLSVFLHKIVH